MAHFLTKVSGIKSRASQNETQGAQGPGLGYLLRPAPRAGSSSALLVLLRSAGLSERVSNETGLEQLAGVLHQEKVTSLLAAWSQGQLLTFRFVHWAEYLARALDRLVLSAFFALSA